MVVSSLSLSRVCLGGSHPAGQAKASLTLSAAATVTLAIHAAARGTKVDVCHTTAKRHTTGKERHAARQQKKLRPFTSATVTRSLAAGKQSVKLSALLAGQPLKRGRYVLTVTPAGGQPVSVAFVLSA